MAECTCGGVGVAIGDAGYEPCPHGGLECEGDARARLVAEWMGDCGCGLCVALAAGVREIDDLREQVSGLERALAELRHG